MTRYDVLKGRIVSLIPNIGIFLKTTSGLEILIAEYERDSTSYILMNVDKINGSCQINGNSITLDVAKVFSIHNSSVVDFIPVDGKKGLLPGTSNCDFVFYNEKHFCFVELKLNATSLDDRAIQKNRTKATRQLTNTIHYFDSIFRGDYCGLALEAYVSTPDIYPRENTAFQSLKVRFLETIGIELFESREKRY